MMKILIILARVLVVPFCLYTLYVVWHTGYVGLLETALSTLAGGQVFTDLVVALLMVLCVMAVDARKHQRRFNLWLITTLCLGSIGPLLYFATARLEQDAAHE